MLLAMGCHCASSTGAKALCLQRESCESGFRGRALSHKLSLRNQARITLKLLTRTWSSEDFHWAHFNLFRPCRLLGLCSHSPQVNSSSAFSHSDDIEFSQVEEMPFSNSRHANALLQVVPCIGRVLLILALGLGLSMPALARTVAPPVSTVSAGDNVMQRDEITTKQEDVNGDVTQSIGNALLGERDDSKDPTLHTVDAASENLNTSEISDDQLRLSENFWRGIPTPEGSYLYKLKLQLDMYPKDSMALEALLRAVMEQRDMLRTLTVLETLLEVQPNDLECKFLKARTHEFLGELLMAKVEYEELLNLRPLSARFLQVAS